MAKWETAPRRAWNDTKEWVIGNTFWAWLIVGILLVVGGAVLGVIWPQTVNGIYGALSGLGILGLLILGTYAAHLILALRRQRNEARALISVKPKPIPISNRKELISAIHQVKETAIEVILTGTMLSHLHEVDPGKTPPQQFVTNFSNAFEKYREALSELERQALIAGEEFHNPINLFFKGINSCVQKPVPPKKEPNSTIVCLNTEENTNKLNDATNKVIKEIDEISQSVSYKEDSKK